MNKITNDYLKNLKSCLLINEDCIKELAKMDDSIFDSVVIDPPYAIDFLGKDWDCFDDPRQFQEWCTRWAAQLLRVVKPGGHLLSFGGTRTFHRMVAGLEDAGWQIRDTLAWIYGSGFPKSKNLANQTDKAFGRTNNGLETGIKPAMELICLARKPLSEKAIQANVDKWGTGGLDIDACRIRDAEQHNEKEGWWPSNIIFDEEFKPLINLQAGVYASKFLYCPKPSCSEINAGLEHLPKVRRDLRDAEAAGVMSKKGLQPQHNPHPTVKPIELLRYLCKLVTPKNGVVLDCFMGSGSCGIAAVLEGFRYVGIEMEQPFADIAELRIKHWLKRKAA